MPWQPLPKMHSHRDVSQVRSQRNDWSASAGSGNSTHARAKSSGTSGTGAAYADARFRETARRARWWGRRAYGIIGSEVFPEGWRYGVRLAVLDVGSNTVHLLVVDAHEGARPLPVSSDKTELRLAEHLTDD